MAKPEVGTSATPNEADPLRQAFVEMLFALAVSQVAIYAADLVRVSSNWSEKLPSLAHLVVGLLLIATSWVGWRQSVSPGMNERVLFVFSKAFLGLLLDVLLVILYFIVVRSVEIDEGRGGITLSPYTAEPEATWVGAVFGVYVVWDLLSDVFCEGGIPRARPLARIKKFCAAGVVSTFASLACLIVALIIRQLAEARTGLDQVVLFDVTLGCVILLFRLLKAAENPLAELFGVRDCKAFATPRQVRGSELPLGALLFGLILVSLSLASKSY